MTTFPVEEELIYEAFDLLLQSLESFVEISSDNVLGGAAQEREYPEWLANVMQRLNKTLFRKAHETLSPDRITPYQIGYAFGIMRWGKSSSEDKFKRLRHSFKSLPHSTRLKRRLGKRVESFMCSTGIEPRKCVSAFIPRKAKKHIADLDRGARLSSSEYHRGLADGLEGIGDQSPNDRSDEATKVHLYLALSWVVVSKMKSVTDLHHFLCSVMGAQVVGEKKRVEKICERIGLNFRPPGRPKKSDSAQPV
ncbi:hypothetical protein [Nibricoccus sp. IMCC34717]|uniref:hypothetical protein n=1 Tax=Nibricoccus sp. IMCC34717 TaxID=3034021 RepID=UPI00384A656F